MRFTNIDVNEKVNLFNKTMKNIILSYIPHETITCNDRDKTTEDNIIQDARNIVGLKKF